ncbi:MAG TPA: substrate binding domain-containing protein, partial [Rhizomicrobium sp.]|nr:substrate binding domain-containing protein [Rhizomicrobium sp.]
NRHGRPKHPLDLAQHRCISYSYTMASEVWRFTKGSRSASVRPSGPLRVNNGDAMMPFLIAGTGIGMLPEFFLREALQSNLLERLLPDWSIPLGAVYWVTPPEGPLTKRVEVLGDFLTEKFAQNDLGVLRKADVPLWPQVAQGTSSAARRMTSRIGSHASRRQV